MEQEYHELMQEYKATHPREKGIANDELRSPR